MDSIVDNYIAVDEEIAKDLEEIETAVFSGSHEANATTIYVYDVAAATMNSVGIGMATDSIMQAAILNNEPVFVASGVALRYSSSGTTALTAIPAGTYLPSFAKFVTLYVSKAWYGGDPNNPSRTTFSASQDPLDTTTANNAEYIDIDSIEPRLYLAARMIMDVSQNKLD